MALANGGRGGGEAVSIIGTHQRGVLRIQPIFIRIRIRLLTLIPLWIRILLYESQKLSHLLPVPTLLVLLSYFCKKFQEADLFPGGNVRSWINDPFRTDPNPQHCLQACLNFLGSWPPGGYPAAGNEPPGGGGEEPLLAGRSSLLPPAAGRNRPPVPGVRPPSPGLQLFKPF
jgi:hypothetical protein